MPVTLDHIAKSQSSDAEKTEHENSQFQGRVAADIAALEQAEKMVKGLRRGEHVWRCPDAGCTGKWQGMLHGHQHKAYLGHVRRHAHARFALAQLNPSSEVA